VEKRVVFYFTHKYKQEKGASGSKQSFAAVSPPMIRVCCYYDTFYLSRRQGMEME